MSKKRSRDTSNSTSSTTELEMDTSNKNPPQKFEQAILQNYAPVRIQFNLFKYLPYIIEV